MPRDITRIESTSSAGQSPRWWRFGMVWFVLSGPAIVIVAGFATMAIAFIHADVELHEPTPMAAFSIRMGKEGGVPVERATNAADATAHRQRPAATP
jgi:hypothetical protein